MYTQASQLVGRPIVAAEEQLLLATIDRLVIEPTTGKVAAFVVHQGGWLGSKRILVTSDILALSNNTITVRDDAVLVEASEVVRVKELLANNIPVLGQVAQTRSGKNLGKVADLLLDSTSWLITKYYLRSLVRDRILPVELIFEITPRAVIFSDQVDEPQEPTAEIETAVA